MYKIIQLKKKINKSLNKIKWLNKFFIAIISTIIIVIFLFILLNGLFPITTQQEIQLRSAGLQYDQIYQEIVQHNHLDKSLLERSWIYFINWFKGDFGTLSSGSDLYGPQASSNRSILDYFLIKNSISYLISTISLLFSLLIGVILGYIAAKKRNTIWDYILNFFTIATLSISLFILIPLVIQIVSSFGIVIEFKKDDFKTYLLPIFSLAIITIAPILQVVRSKAIEIFTSSFYLFFLSMGIRKWKLFWKIIFPNLFTDLMSLMPFLLIGLFAASVFLEYYFNIPGTWQYLYATVTSYENYLICFMILFLGLTYSLVYTFGEIVKVLIDPRERIRKHE